MNSFSHVLEWTIKEILKDLEPVSLAPAKYKEGTVAYFKSLGYSEQEAQIKRKAWRKKYCREKMRERRENGL